MPSLAALVDDILLRLQDDETLFTRAEIVRWLSEAYRQMSHRTRFAKTFSTMDMPPRHTRAITFNWERNIGSGSWRKWTFTNQNDHTECTFLWEVQQAGGMDSPGSGTVAVSNLWELAYASGSVDTHYRFMLPKQDAGIIHVWHDHDFISAVTAKILDSTETAWWYIGGSEPYVWLRSLGDAHSFDVYGIDTEYFQSFDVSTMDMGNARGWFEAGENTDTYAPDSGIASWAYAYAWDGEPESGASGAISGVGKRFTFGPNEDGNYYTHDWEGDTHPYLEAAVGTTGFESGVDLEIGLMRSGVSSSRQYWPSHQWQTTGTLRQAGKSENALLVYHDVYAADITGEETETPMLPDPLRKYLGYYALSILFNRQGEGYDPALAGHYELRAARGFKFLQAFGMIQRADQHFVRGGGQRGTREPPLPQLPADYPRAPWLR